MKILAIGDPHAKLDNTLEIKMLRQKIVEKIEEKKPDKVIILGDLSHYFARMYIQPWLEIVDFIDNISEVSEVYYIVGNHDLLNNTQFLSKCHFFSVFNNWKGRNVTIVDRCVFINPSILCVPYVYPGRFHEALDASGIDGNQLQRVKMIFCHQEFRNAKMGAIKSRVGDEWHPDLPMVFSGHIHDRDLLQPNILYVGAPYQVSYGDNSSKSVEFIEMLDGKITYSPIDLGMPKKITLKTTAKEFLKLKDFDENSKYRIFVIDNSESLHRLKKNKKYKELEKKFKIITQPTDTLKRKSAPKQGFGEVVNSLIEKESDLVQEEYHGVMKNVNKN